MANTQAYREIEESCLAAYYKNEELIKVHIDPKSQRALFGSMEIDIIGYSKQKKTLHLGEFTASGYFGLNGGSHHIGANRKLAEAFLKLFVCHNKEKDVIKYLDLYEIQKVRYIFAVPNGALFLKSLTYQNFIFSNSFLELKQIEIDKEEISKLEKTYRTARAENKTGKE
jgi:hypothetical protein